MKKLFLAFLIILSIFMISAVAADENITKINDIEAVSVEKIEIHETNPIEESTATISKPKPNIRIFPMNITVEGDAVITANCDPNVTGTIYIPEFNDTMILVNGSARYELHNLTPNMHIFNLTYSGDDNFSGFDTAVAVMIPEYFKDIEIKQDDVEMYYRNGTKFTATIYKDKKPFVNRTVYLVINKITYQRTTNENGTIYLNINLNPGKYTIRTGIIQKGFITTSYNPYHFSALSNITVLPTIVGNNLTKYYKNNTQYEVTAFDGQGKILSNSTLKFNVNGVFYNRTTDNNGKAKLNINLVPGKYIITTEGNDTLKISNTLNVLPTIVAEDLLKICKNDSQFFVKLLTKNGTPLKNAKLRMNINGVFYNRVSDANGLAKLNINLPRGHYIITIENLDDNCTVSNNIEVKDYLYTFDMVKYYKNASRYTVKLLDENHNPVANEKVQITVNGISYEKTTNKEGIASLAINLLPGEYEVVAKTLDDKFESVSKIKILPTLLVQESNVINNAKNERYPVTILDGNGKPLPDQEVVFSFGQESKTSKTNSKGIAYLPLFNYIPPNPSLTTSYNGYSVTKDNIKFIILHEGYAPSIPVEFL